MTKDKSYIIASSHFLTNELPKNWSELSDGDLDIFIDKNRWAPFEDKSTSFIWECIEVLARDFQFAEYI